jgi:flagellar basal-body rod protein FlgG
VTPDGNPIQPEITIPEQAMKETIHVATDGTVSYRTAGQNDTTQVAGQLILARFINPQGLEAIGSNLYLESATSGPAITGIPTSEGFGQTQGGMLEFSNVEIVDELVSMIFGQRAYEINSKAIQTADQMLETAVNVKR